MKPFDKEALGEKLALLGVGEEWTNGAGTPYADSHC